MDDPVFKAKYQKCKYKVKLWEKSFLKIHGRIPSKHDIREAPRNILDSYKKYYKLKSSFLEDTLNDVLDEDGFDLSLEGSQLDASGSERNCPALPDFATDSDSGHPSFSNVNEIGATSLTNLRNFDDRHVIKEFEAEVVDNDYVSSVNKDAWGPTLNKTAKTTAAPVQTKPASQEVRKSVTNKLFKNSSFSVRNPRKSLSRNNSTVVTSISQQLATRDVLPDLESILAEKAKKQMEIGNQETVAKSESIVSQAAASLHIVDSKWLNRCNAANSLGNVEDTSSGANVSSQSVKYGLLNINVNLKLSEQTTSVQTTPSLGLSSLTIGEPKSGGHVETYSKPTYDNTHIAGGDDCDDDDEVIENSEDESTTANVTSLRHIAKKRKIEDVKPIAPTLPEPVVQKAKKAQKTKSATIPKKVPKKAIKRSISPQINNPKKSITSRRSTRNSTRTVTKDSSASEWDEVDSDNDPEFKLSKKDVQKVMHEDLDDENEEPNKSEIPKKTKDKVPKQKKEKTLSSKAKKSKAAPRKSTSSQPSTKRKPFAKSKPDPHHSDMDEDEYEEEPRQDYMPEFGSGSIQSVPRINIDELQASTQAFENYVHTSQTLPRTASNPNQPTTDYSQSTASYDALEKRAKDRTKIEKKIAAGTMNENFVRINIQKKVFSRGHKSVNFSRFKKNQWKKTKAAAALAGPEMDMRGCDGGFLVCFQCGQQGHFAQDCKIQTDKLLPLSADVEVSQYPTLDEVEQMAAESSHFAHSRKSNSLPLASNLKWKDDLPKETGSTLNLVDEEEKELPKIVSESPLPSVTKTVAKQFIGQTIPEEFLKLAGLDVETAENSLIRPLYDLTVDGQVQAPTSEVLKALKMFGHTSFRKGQDRAVMRILSGQPTLVTLSTGTGKSLCYQLPAYIYRQHRKCITLVISPLVSLMEDQVHDMPDFLNAQCLHTNQTKAQRTKILESIKAGEVDVLLISPEAVVSGEKATGFGSLLRELPPIAFVCIDEAHCMSQWSHNFRPSYLMICRVLQEKLKVKTVLGLTATATYQTRESIVQLLAIPDGLNGVISDIPLPNNLLLTVSKDVNRDVALIKLLKSEKFTAFQSIIVYCTRRDECERVAKYIRMCFQEEEKQLQTDGATTNKRKRVRSYVEFYHAGMPASRRKKIQNDFMRSDLKIVVATIAFGMGINKADIRAVIHYNMPMTYENYTQEVGRAGRDGKDSHCHLFLEANKNDLVELRRHIYANSIDRHVIRKLLQKVFVPCACATNIGEYKSDIDAIQNMSWTDDMNDDDEVKTVEKKNTPGVRHCSGHEACFSIEDTVQELDIPEENISTLLCYLELHEQRYIKVLSKAYCMCKVMSYGGSNSLKLAARTCAPLAMAIALDLKKGVSHQDSTSIEFRVVDIASAIGWNSGVVKHQLKNLEWTTVNGAPKRSKISVQFDNLGFRLMSPGDLTDDELDATLDLLHNRTNSQEKTQLLQLQNVFNGLYSVATDFYSEAIKDPAKADQRSTNLKLMIRDYFQSKEIKEIKAEHNIDTDRISDQQLITDIHTMMSRYPENEFTGRTLARIFHGIASPVYPAQIWSRCNFWRAYTKVDFNRIVKTGNAEIVKYRT